MTLQVADIGITAQDQIPGAHNTAIGKRRRWSTRSGFIGRQNTLGAAMFENSYPGGCRSSRKASVQSGLHWMAFSNCFSALSGRPVAL